MFKLFESGEFVSLEREVEARWRLVETAWSLNISSNLLQIQQDEENQMLFTIVDRVRRVNVTSSRDVLNGYQKGKCFYCFDEISVEPGADNLADVDHFFPHKLHKIVKPINGVWNLVLACSNCNRGSGGKFDSLPSRLFLDRLHNRNEWLIASHHLLPKILKQQTGKHKSDRRKFIDQSYEVARIPLGYSQWQPELKGFATF